MVDQGGKQLPLSAETTSVSSCSLLSSVTVIVFGERWPIPGYVLVSEMMLVLDMLWEVLVFRGRKQPPQSWRQIMPRGIAVSARATFPGVIYEPIQ